MTDKKINKSVLVFGKSGLGSYQSMPINPEDIVYESISEFTEEQFEFILKRKRMTLPSINDDAPYEDKFLPCPVCNGKMQSEFGSEIICPQCGLRYPIDQQNDIDRWNNRNLIISQDRSFDDMLHSISNLLEKFDKERSHSRDSGGWRKGSGRWRRLLKS